MEGFTQSYIEEHIFNSIEDTKVLDPRLAWQFYILIKSQSSS